MSELTLKWNGQNWEVSGVPESMQLRRDSIFTVEAPASVFEPAGSEADRLDAQKHAAAIKRPPR